ncbi:MAG: hypothetical protein ISR85_05865 [Kiritimatiellales bacterium]|nr:hypothetical protein [Kiritimatiellota bacterium]MBL7012437.1 hypothetical protein [Kiritimatiellales bacterium]
MAMKQTAILYVTLALGSALSAGADDVLDAKLNALKTKATQRTYSSRALLDNQSFIVPKAATDEEKTLDAKLRAMDKKLDQASSVLAGPVSLSPYMPRPAQEEPVNWLTPALLDDAASKNNSSEGDEDSWITMELLRQNNIKLEKMEQADGRAAFDQRLRGEVPDRSITPYNPLKGDNDTLPSMYSSGPVTPATRQASPKDSNSTYTRSQTPTPDTLRSAPDSPSALPGSWRSRSTAQGTFPERSRPFGKTQTPAPSSLSPSWTTPNSETPAPSKRVRRTLPTHTENPFEDDFMPTIKKSIWD